MRVQSIGANYNNQNKPSFQAEGVFVKKCLDKTAVTKVYEAGRKLADQLNAEKVPSTFVGANSVNLSPFVFITVGTDAKFDKTVIPMFEKFAQDHGFESDIKSGFSFNMEALDAKAKEIVARLKKVTENGAQSAFTVETDAFIKKTGPLSNSSCQDGGGGVKKIL